MFSREIFATRIRTLRSINGLTQGQLGDSVGLTKQAINNIESGLRITALDKAYALADYFDVSLDYLVGRSDDPQRR